MKNQIYASCIYKKISKHHCEAFMIFVSVIWWSKQFPAKACTLLHVLLLIGYDAYASPPPALWPLFPVYLITIQLCIESAYCLLLRNLRVTFITVGARRLLIICLARKAMWMPCSLYSQGQVYPARWSVLVIRAEGGEWQWQSVLFCALSASSRMLCIWYF